MMVIGMEKQMLMETEKEKLRGWQMVRLMVTLKEKCLVRQREKPKAKQMQTETVKETLMDFQMAKQTQTETVKDWLIMKQMGFR